MRHLLRRLRRSDTTRATRLAPRVVPPQLLDYPIGRRYR